MWLKTLLRDRNARMPYLSAGATRSNHCAPSKQETDASSASPVESVIKFREGLSLTHAELEQNTAVLKNGEF